MTWVLMSLVREVRTATAVLRHAKVEQRPIDYNVRKALQAIKRRKERKELPVFSWCIGTR